VTQSHVYRRDVDLTIERDTAISSPRSSPAVPPRLSRQRCSAHGGRQRGGWTNQCSGTDPGAVPPARDGCVRHSYPHPSAPQARSLAASDDQSHADRPLPQERPNRITSSRLARSCSFSSRKNNSLLAWPLAASNRDHLGAGGHSFRTESLRTHASSTVRFPQVVTRSRPLRDRPCGSCACWRGSRSRSDRARRPSI